MGLNIFTAGTLADASKVNENFEEVKQELGEVKMFALSMTGAVTKASLQSKGWAICDGTTPTTQGISSPTIATTPDLQDKSIKMSDDETSGGVSGWSHNHTYTVSSSTLNTSGVQNITGTQFYELAYFIKVKVL